MPRKLRGRLAGGYVKSTAAGSPRSVPCTQMGYLAVRVGAGPVRTASGVPAVGGSIALSDLVRRARERYVLSTPPIRCFFQNR